MKYLLATILIFLSFSNSVLAQKTSIEGQIKSQDGTPLLGATIQIDKGAGTTTDNQGNFELEVDRQRNYKLKIRMIGYSNLDTIVNTSLDKIYLQISLNPFTYESPEIEVVESKLKIFDANDWRILDFDLRDGQLFILYIYRKKRYIGLYGHLGFKIHELELREKFNEIFISCNNRLHLIGSENCVEANVLNSKIILKKTYKRTLYDKLIKPCVLNINQELVFKKLSVHNKRAQYFKYPEPNQPVLIQEIFDKKGAKVSQSYYNEIIGMYNSTVLVHDDEDIDKGFARVNIIQRGEWSGDLHELIIDNSIHFAVAYYEKVESKEIALLEFEIEGYMYVIDIVNEKMFKINTSTLNINTILLNGFDWDRKSQILKDEYANKIYLINQKEELFALDIKDDRCELIRNTKLNLEGIFPQGFKIFNDNLYYFSLNSTNSSFTKFFRQKINNN